MNRILKVGLIGAGSSATNIAETIVSTEGIELVGISDVYKPGAQSLADKHGVKIVSNDYKEILGIKDLDFVIVSVPHGAHHKIVIDALKSGKHVLTEKPIATKIEDAQDMIKVAKENNRKLGVHFQCRFFGAVQEAKKMIDSGEIGKILQVNISVMWFRDTDYYKKSNWRGTWELEGGGSLINQAIHPVDEMVYLIGDVKKLFGLWGHKIHDIEVDDNTAAAFLFENGAFGTLQTSTATKSAFPAKLTIFGSEKGLEIDGNVLTIHNPDDTSEVKDFTGGGQIGSSKDPKKFSLASHRAMLEDFMDSIINDRDPMVTGEEGLRSLKIVRAVYDSNGEKIIDL